MAARELVVLGTASQVPTRDRNHGGYLLRWDEEAVLFDPGEGTQRQLLLAGVPASAITRICITHFHGDHCLGLPGVLQRLSLDRVDHPVEVYFPASGRPYFERMRSACSFHERAELRVHPVHDEGPVAPAPPFELIARRLEHEPDTLGWRLREPDGRRLLPERLAALGVHGPDIGRLQREGAVELRGRRIALEEVSVPRRGQRVAFVMDTRLCDSAFALAEDADLLICEATFASADQRLAAAYLHLTAAQAARIAAAAGARQLVLTHFSQRYADVSPLLDEAREVFPRTIAAHDLARIPLPPRRFLTGRPGMRQGKPDT
jgi:ribonuclease Z